MNIINKLIRFVKNKLINRMTGFFSDVNIETYGYCNRQCSFCFNNDKYPKREIGVMEEEIFRRIIDELGNLDFSGRVGLHHYGEPLLDDRLPQFIEYVRKKCPKREKMRKIAQKTVATSSPVRLISISES